MKNYYHTIQVFLIAFFLVGKTIGQTCTPASIPYPALGGNIGDVVSMPWINLWHQMTPSHSQVGSDGIVIDTDGWTTTKTNHNVVIGRDVSIVKAIVGKVKISYRGTLSQLDNFGATNGINNLVSNANFPSTGYSYYEFDVNIPLATNSELTMRFHEKVSEVKIMRPGYEIAETQIIDQDYLFHIKPFSTLRWMGFLSANTAYVNNQWDCASVPAYGGTSIAWNQRPNFNAPQSINQSLNKGGSWEHVVQLSNELNTHLWINIPVWANNDYLDNLARYLKGNLKSSLLVYFELGNESWNNAGGFCTYRQFENVVPNFAANSFQNFREYNAKRTKEIVDRFALVWGWGEINNRVRAVIGGQISYGVPGDGWCVGHGIDYMYNNFGEASIKKYFYEVGAAPYFGNSPTTLMGVNTILDNCQSDIDNRIFGEFSSEFHGPSNQFMGNKLEGWLGKAGQYGLKLIAYEGGPDMDYTSGGGGNKALAMADPRMKDLCLDYWTTWYARYGYNSLFNHFLAQFGNTGLYTIAETMGVASTRDEALLQIATNPAPIIGIDGYRHTIPGIIDARKISGYWSAWASAPFLQYQRSPDVSPGWGGSDGYRAKWTVGAQKNGIYRISVEHNSARKGVQLVDFILDGTTVAGNVQFRSTGFDYCDAAQEPDINTGVGFIYHDEPHLRFPGNCGGVISVTGTVVTCNISMGVHVFTTKFINNVDDNFRNIKFTLISELPPFRPSVVLGDLQSCSNQAESKFEVDVDASVCAYKWVGLPATASINPDAGVPPSGIPRSGLNTNLIFVDWGSTPAGNYIVTVFGINAVGTSPGRAFNVLVTTCGFSMNPSPACANSPVNVVPAVPIGSIMNWNFGSNSVPQVFNTTSLATIIVSYSAAGVKNISLTITLPRGAVRNFNPGLTVAAQPTIGVVVPVNQAAS